MLMWAWISSRSNAIVTARTSAAPNSLAVIWGLGVPSEPAQHPLLGSASSAGLFPGVVYNAIWSQHLKSPFQTCVPMSAAEQLCR